MGTSGRDDSASAGPARPDGRDARVHRLASMVGLRVGVPLAVLKFLALRANLVVMFSRLMLCRVAAIWERAAARHPGARGARAAARARALHRTEREVHDGPQQGILLLGLELGRARRDLDGDPDGARRVLRAAVPRACGILAELWALWRGRPPPVLADRGLAAALDVLAARSRVPVELAVGLPGRPIAAGVETVVYFLVAEALANVARHSRATSCRVRVEAAGGRLGVEIVDDGEGGARPRDGHGLSGLTGRLSAVGGTLAVHSPPGGPTRLTAELPLP